MRRLPDAILRTVSAVTLLSTFSVAAGEPGLVDDRASPHAQVRSVGLDQVYWTHGFWADRFALCRQQMIPAMWQLMAGTNYSQFYQNFRIYL